MIDLHTHSNISDGNLSPEILVKEAIKQGLTALALTDHDSINGLENARIAAASYNKIDGKAEKFRFITGVELNINWSGGKGVPGIGPGAEFHLLGLGFTPNPAFIAAIDDLSCRREARNRGILEKMYELSMIDDIDGAWRELLAIAGHGLQGNSQSNSLGRLHFAVFLIKRKLVRNIDQAFARYLGVGKPLYVPKEGLRFDEAAALIRESGGIPVLAHPASLYVA
ncbi:MAG: PHP domain-containing protein, partial [Treponema sp.]|nr:PHP domain-containing protein [Treponema sp.]